MNQLRRFASLPGVRRVLLHPRIRRLAASILGLRYLLGAFETTKPWRLLLGEMTNRGQTRRYTLRSSGLPVYVLQGQGCEGLYYLFRHGEYEPPAHLLTAVGEPRRILDIGAAAGMFAAWAIGRWPQAKITCIEPEPQMLESLRELAVALPDRIEVIEAAAGPCVGTVEFVDGWAGGSHIQAAGEDLPTRSVPQIDIFDLLGEADLVKMDIEGGEWPILADARMSRLRGVLTMEYHRVGAPSLPARDAAIALLADAGIESGFGESNYWGHGTLWAWPPSAERAEEESATG